MVYVYLKEWGCPAAIVQALDPTGPPISSRDLLLALAWLVGHGRVFQRLVSLRAPSLDDLMQLPPYPEVSGVGRSTYATQVAHLLM